MRIKGVLLPGKGTVVRIYSKNGEFTDLEVVHDDLAVEINDDTATIRKDKDGEHYIDYNDSVLGK
jgi:hypothetical protein